MQRIVEWYLGIPPARPGQSIRWEWQFQQPSGVSWPVVLVALLVVLGLSAWLYVRESRTTPGSFRWIALGLRVAALLLLFVLLARPTLTIARTGLPWVAVMIDTSASMSQADDFPADELPDALRQSLPEQSGAAATRLDVVRGLLTDPQSRFLERMARQHNLRLYQFDSEPRLLVSSADAASVTELAEAIRLLRPTGPQTRLATSLRTVLDEASGTSPAAVVVLTDGVATTTAADRLSAGAEEAARAGVPLMPVVVGSDNPPRDVELTEVLAEELTFLGDPVSLMVHGTAHGFRGRTVRIVLREAGRDEILAETTVDIDSDDADISALLSYRPQQAGDYEFVVRAVPLPGEHTVENNELVQPVRVREQQVRVLLVERTPRWEFRFLKAALEREPTVRVNTVLQEADLQYVAEDRTALPRFPLSREELFEFDVVILGDVDPGSLQLSAAENLRDFVAEHGGGLILIAGERNNPAAFFSTPLADALPVTATAPTGNTPGPGGYRLERTPEGERRLELRLADELDQDQQVWSSLPPLYWLQTDIARKPGAESLVVARDDDDTDRPAIVSHRFGAGQVVFHATDALWRWRRDVEDRYYGRYWGQMIRALSRGRLAAGSEGIQLTADRTVYQMTDPIRLRARFANPGQVPQGSAPVRVQLEDGPAGEQIVELAPRDDLPGLYEATLTGIPPGNWRAWVIEPALTETPAAVDFRIELPRQEFRVRGVNRSDLERAATLSGGQCYSLADVDDLPDDLPRGRAIPVSRDAPLSLWNRWEALALLTMLLAAEWMIRRRGGLA
ncbi:VWA domain-containing protein [Maioricimonas sp. JC845]|uniref:VWA domain-containing protein n=1 Tax=Maioricimonas sp. JC845 TaxID=3232138 RepID=UPI003457CEA5